MGLELGPEDVNKEVRGVLVDEMGRSRAFQVFSCGRPWFRGFHTSWISFFLAFLGWFAIVPALEYLVDDPSNNIDNDARLTSNIISVLGTVFIRLALGPLLEKWGPKRIQSALLSYGAVMVMLSATVRSAAGLYAIRFAISFVGGAFVPCQFWTSMMFAGNVVGQANAFAGGWGNLGGGFTTLVVAALISGFKNVVDEYTAWRIAMIFPGLCMLAFSVPMLFISDDCPQGTWEKRLYRRTFVEPEKEDEGQDEEDTREQDEAEVQGKTAKTTRLVENESFGPWMDWRVWLLFVQYAACFGVELTINNSMTSYLYREFTTDDVINGTDCSSEPSNGDFEPECSILGKDTAAMIAALFGLQNIYARPLGGIISDWVNKNYDMKGRLWVQFVTLFLEGAMLIIFSRITSLPLAIVFLILFSIFVQMSEGSTYSLVPFVRTNVGTVAGIVGAGGNVGAVLWATMFRGLSSTKAGLLYLGIIVCLSSFLTFVLHIQGVGIFSNNKHEKENENGRESPLPTSPSIEIPSTTTSLQQV